MELVKHRRGLRFIILSFVCIFVVFLIQFGETQLAKARDRILDPGDPYIAVPLEIPEVASPIRNSAFSTNGSSIQSIAGSTITTVQCYDANSTQTLCFRVYNASPDNEWLDFVRLTFPTLNDGWTVDCYQQDPADSSGNPVNLTCHVDPGKTYEVTYDDLDVETPTSIGEIAAGTSWMFCVDVGIPPGFNGPRLIHWGLSGDEGSEITDKQIEIPQCTPLMVRPDQVEIEGCNGVPQYFDIEIWNHDTYNGPVDVFYEVPTGNGVISGPESFIMGPGDVITFSVALTPAFYTRPGEVLVASIVAERPGETDGAVFQHTTTALAGWQPQENSPVATMDNAVAWAVQDGGLWSIGGYGSAGAAQRYDPTSDSWITYTNPLTPVIEYPMDGCYGLDNEDHEVIVLFPDTIITGTLQRFDITDKAWEEIPIPVGYPEEGRWSQEIVSLYNVTSLLEPGSPRNLCYMSGGSTMTGGGRVKNLWSYDPALNQIVFLQNFTYHYGFDFHASWYVPWIGEQGAICVAGGIDLDSGVLQDSQCYDIGANNFNDPNIDLGPLPEPWWGMADGWQIYNGEYQLWLANGVAQDGSLLPVSAYYSQSNGAFLYGPGVPVSLYRLEGDGWQGRFYTLGGAMGGFSYSKNNLLLGHCPVCYDLFTPLIMKYLP